MLAFLERCCRYPVLRHLLLPCIGMAVGMVALAYVALAQMHAKLPLADDFYSFYASAERVSQGQSPYWPLLPRRHPGDPCHPTGPLALDLASMPVADLTPAQALVCRAPNLNPPVLAVLSQPLAWMPPGLAANVWMGLGLTAMAIALWWLSRALWPAAGRPVRLWAMLVLGLLMWFPTWLSAMVGQVTLVLSLPLVGAWLALRRGSPWLAGGLIGLLCGVKLFFGLLVAGLLLMRMWRAAASAILTLVALCVLGGWATTGWSAYRDYAQALEAVIWLTNNFNGSLHGYVARFFIEPDRLFWNVVPREAKALSWALAAGVAGVWWHGLRAASARTLARADLLFTLTVPAMLLINPLGWVYYFPWLILPVCLVWRASEGQPDRGTVLAALALLVALAAVPRSLMSHPPFLLSEWLIDWGGYTCLLLLALALGWLARRRIGHQGGIERPAGVAA